MARNIELLHVEDDESQRRLVAHHLKRIPECTFSITAVDTEEEALAAFDARPADLVILDYQLNGGNGLSCLRGLRERNALVPIVAVSGTASPQTAADLLRNGADDFLRKQEMTSSVLAQSIGTALARADAWRRRVRNSPDLVRAKAIVQLLHQSLQDRSSQWLLQHFQTLEKLLRRPWLTSRDWKELLAIFPIGTSSSGDLLRTLLIGLREQSGKTN